MAKDMQATPHLVQYIRDHRTGRRRGVMVGMANPDGGFLVGFSLCHKRDRFDRDLGLRIASARALTGSSASVPHSMRSEMERFKQRCAKYFKQDESQVA